MNKNVEKNIEVELRAEVSLDQFNELLSELKKKSGLLSQTKRLSVMFLGKVDQLNFDIRVRINVGGDAEIVIKKGEYHAHNRTELSQEIGKDQFIGMVKFFSLFEFQSKITERENFEFDLGDGIVMSVVRAGSIAYVEVEKISDNKNVDKIKKKLTEILEGFQLKSISENKEFNDLCERLTRYSDSEFNGSKEDIERLKEMLVPYGVFTEA